MTPDEMVNKRIGQLLKTGTGEVSKYLKKHEQELVKQYLVALDGVKSQISQMYEKFGDDVDIGTMRQYQRLSNLEKAIDLELQKIQPGVIAGIKRNIRDAYKETFNVAGFAHQSVFSINFGQFDPKQVTASILNPMDRVKWTGRLAGHHQKYAQIIKSEISQGIIKGQGYVKTANIIKGKVEGLSNNMLRIVRTETHRAQQAGLKAGFDEVKRSAKRKGIDLKEVWISTKDMRTRDSHQSMDGEVADEDGMFTLIGKNAGVKVPFPGGTGIAEEDIHCRCGMRTELAGFAPKKMRDGINKEVVPFAKYHDWIKSRGGSTVIPPVVTTVAKPAEKKQETKKKAKKENYMTGEEIRSKLKKYEADVEETLIPMRAKFDTLYDELIVLNNKISDTYSARKTAGSAIERAKLREEMRGEYKIKYDDYIKTKKIIKDKEDELWGKYKKMFYAKKKGKFNYKSVAKGRGKAWLKENGVDEYMNIIGDNVIDERTVTFRSTSRGRSYYQPLSNDIYLSSTREVNSTTVIHELCHWVEEVNKDIFDMISEFYNKRTAGEALRSLGRDVKGYGLNELYKPDKWVDPYMGVYYSYNGERIASEVLSMGLQLIYRDAIMFAKKDPEHFDFVIKLLRSQNGNN